MNNGEKIAYYTMLIAIVFIFVFGALLIIDMLIDHYCYTTPLNEINNKNMCERYWK